MVNPLKLRIGIFIKKILKPIKRYFVTLAGSDIIIMSDFNQCFTTKDAIKRCHELDNIGFYWFEEPIQYNFLEDMKKICEEIKTPITIGKTSMVQKMLMML